MYSSTDKSYLQARAIKKGGYQLDVEAQEIVDWFSHQCQVKALDFYFYTVETDRGYRQQHIRVIVEREEESDRLEKQDRTEMVKQFRHYFSQRHSQKDKLKSDFFPVREGEKYPETVLGFLALETIEIIAAYEKADQEIRDLQKQFPEIWSMTKNSIYWTIFYYTDHQWKDNEANGNTRKLKDAILAALRKHDTFGFVDERSLKYILFDTKQNLDENYQGNMYYYFK